MPKTPLTNAEKQARFAARKRAAGLVRQSVWARPENWPLIRELESALQKPREGGIGPFAPPPES